MSEGERDDLEEPEQGYTVRLRLFCVCVNSLNLLAYLMNINLVIEF